MGSGGTIEGLAINRCPSYGLYISGDGNTIVGNYIGTDATGSADVSTTYDGILLANGSENNSVGGPGEEERNVISGNNSAIRMFGASTTGNVIQGNYIGTDRTGASALGNNYGIKIQSGAHDNTIGPNNVIAYNSSDGVVVDGGTTTGNTIAQNSIHSNGALGISLTYGGNDSVASPVISSKTCASAGGTAPLNATVELFTGPDDEGELLVQNRCDVPLTLDENHPVMRSATTTSSGVRHRSLAPTEEMSVTTCLSCHAAGTGRAEE